MQHCESHVLTRASVMSSPVLLATRKYVELSDRALVDWALKSGAPGGGSKKRTREMRRWPPARGRRPKHGQFAEVTFAEVQAQGLKPLNHCLSSPQKCPPTVQTPRGLGPVSPTELSNTDRATICEPVASVMARRGVCRRHASRVVRAWGQLGCPSRR